MLSFKEYILVETLLSEMASSPEKVTELRGIFSTVLDNSALSNEEKLNLLTDIIKDGTLNVLKNQDSLLGAMAKSTNNQAITSALANLTGGKSFRRVFALALNDLKTALVKLTEQLQLDNILDFPEKLSNVLERFGEKWGGSIKGALQKDYEQDTGKQLPDQIRDNAIEKLFAMIEIAIVQLLIQNAPQIIVNRSTRIGEKKNQKTKRNITISLNLLTQNRDPGLLGRIFQKLPGELKRTLIDNLTLIATDAGGNKTKRAVNAVIQITRDNSISQKNLPQLEQEIDWLLTPVLAT